MKLFKQLCGNIPVRDVIMYGRPRMSYQGIVEVATLHIGTSHEPNNITPAPKDVRVHILVIKNHAEIPICSL